MSMSSLFFFFGLFLRDLVQYSQVPKFLMFSGNAMRFQSREIALKKTKFQQMNKDDEQDWCEITNH